ncbi:MAG: hypothetical protein Q7R70_01855 [Candidatus Diapherotrites archaeon]|nr:hypothetical protein [Candidatus Diapherotrites archaeon]
MSAKIEVEHRGLLSERRFNELNSFFRKNGKFLGEKDRFSIIYFQKRCSNILELKDNTIDLRLRITDKKAELCLKHGVWGSKDSRREISIPIDSKKFDEAVEFLRILGFVHGVLNATKTFSYKYNGIEFALVKVPKWGNYFEAEILTSKRKMKKADGKLDAGLKKLGLKIVDEKQYHKLLNDLNNRPGFRFDFEKESFSRVKKRFKEYF